MTKPTRIEPGWYRGAEEVLYWDGTRFTDSINEHGYQFTCWRRNALTVDVEHHLQMLQDATDQVTPYGPGPFNTFDGPSDDPEEMEEEA